MPRHGVPAVLLSDNGRQFVAAMLRGFCSNIGICKIYSTPYHPQGNSIVESYMRTLKKGLAALVGEGGRDWDLFLPAVVLAHSTTPHIVTGFSLFFLSHGREAVLPVQGHLGEPRLDSAFKQWLYRLWRSRVLVYEAPMQLEEKRRKFVESFSTSVPVGTLVLAKLTQQDKADCPGKFVPSYMGPGVMVEQFSNGMTYMVRDLASAEQRQLTRDQFKMMDVPGPADDGGYQNVPLLPRLAIPDAGHQPLGEDSGDETEPQPEELPPEDWNVPPAYVPPTTSEEPERPPRAAMDSTQLPCVVPMQRKSAR